jgi:hypothetical protein
MNENLSQMVKDTTPKDSTIFSETDLDLPEEAATEVEETPNLPSMINIVPLSDWFEQNCDQFENINQVKVAIRGVDPAKTLIMAVKDQSGEQDTEGNDRRNLRVFENADAYPVLNLPGALMDVYNNGFRIVYEYENNIFVKCYGVRTGLIAVFCNNIDGSMIPYNITRVKKKDTEVEVAGQDIDMVLAKLLENADLEALQLRYKQSAKAIDELTTNQDVVTWLLARQAEVTDINHHLQIDGVLIDTLA